MSWLVGANAQVLLGDVVEINLTGRYVVSELLKKAPS